MPNQTHRLSDRSDPLPDFVLPERCWFDEKYEKKLAYRHKTFKRAFQEVLRSSGPDRIFVETGCVREKDDYSAGYSTVLIGEVLSRYGGHLDTVDSNPRNMKICKSLTALYSAVLTYNIGDSVEFLDHWAKQKKQRIDFLYLDSYDYPLSPTEGSIDPPQQHCLAELNAALPSLHSESVVLIDDGRLPGGGKPRLAKLRLAELGWECLLDEYQTLWKPRV